MAKLVAYIFIVCSLILWYFLLFHGGGGVGGSGGGSSVRSGAFVAASSEGRDKYYERSSGQITRQINHCWRRYDGYNMQNTVVNKKEQLKKAYGILCNFKCTWLFMIGFPTCEFIYDYKLSCYLFTSLPDCTSVKCTLADYFS